MSTDNIRIDCPDKPGNDTLLSSSDSFGGSRLLSLSLLYRIPGPAWLVLCALLQVCMVICLRKLVGTYKADLLWLISIRHLIGILIMAIPALAGKWSLNVHSKGAFTGRGLFGALSMLVGFIVLNKIGLGRAAVLINLAAVFATLFAIPLLKEWPRPIAALAVLLGTVGVMLCSANGIPQGWEWIALLAAVFAGLTFPYIRKLRQTDNNQVVFLSQCVFGLAMLIPFLKFSTFPVSAAVWQLTLVMIGCDIVSQFFLSQGYATVSVAKGTTIMMLAPILTLLAGLAFFAEVLTVRQWIGSGVVLAAGLIAVMARTRRNKKKVTTEYTESTE